MKTFNIELVRKLYADGRYPEVLKYIQELESSGYIFAELLVRKAMCLQLVELPIGEFVEVEGIFKSALDLDPKSIQALIEYGWYKLNVLDDASGAEELFRRAQHLQVDINSEIAMGLLKCMEVTSPHISRHTALSDLVSSLVDPKKVHDYLDQ
jgi:hypothetical protein